MSKVGEKQKLEEIRSRLAAIAPGDWMVRAVVDGQAVVACTGAFGERGDLCTLDAGASRDELEFLVNAPDYCAFLIGLVDRAIAALGKPSAAQGAARQGAPVDNKKDYAAEAAMACDKRAFKAFMHECHGLEQPLTTDRVASRLRSVLAISSRKELNDDCNAAARWKALRGDFEHWKRAG